MIGIRPRGISSRLAWVLAAHFVLGLVYSLAIPMWEAYDEWGHYAYVRFIADNFRLPRPEDERWVANDERHQPPLYYFVTGAVTAWIEAPSDFFPARNLPFSEDVAAGYNVAVHLDDEAFPYRGAALPVHAARLVSVLLSTLGVWATYRMVVAWLPDHTAVALLAAAIHGFWPQFLFNGSVVTNDIMASVSASLFLAALFDWLFTPPSRTSTAAVLVGLLMLGLSKFSVYGLVAYGLLVFGIVSMVRLYTAIRGRALEARSVTGVLIAFLLAGGLVFWQARATNVPVDTLAGKYLDTYLATYLSPEVYLRLEWIDSLQYLVRGFRTFWALFGWGNLEAPAWTYLAYGLLASASALGLGLRLMQSPREAAGGAVLLAGIAASISAPLLRSLVVETPDLMLGRFFLAAISPISALIALGYSHLWPERLRSKAMLALGLGFAVLAAALPFTTILPAYARPALLEPEAERLIEHPLDVRYGDGIRLAGYDLSPIVVRPGEPVNLTLYWHSLRPVQENYILAVKAVSPDMAILDEKYLFPGRGNFATSLWKPSDFFKETYTLQVPADAEAPFRGQFVVDFLDAEWKPALSAQDGQGNSVPTWFGEFKVAGEAPAVQPPVETTYMLGEEFALYGYRMDLEPSAIRADLFWEAHRPVATDYTVSVALLDDAGRIWAQADGQPRGGTYPTHLWQAGEKVLDPHVLPLPADIPCGDYNLYLGLYDPLGQIRLPVFNGAGVEAADRAIKVPVRLGEGCVAEGP